MENTYIKRETYLQKLIDRMDNGEVKIITGPRRCGKSWLLKRIFKDHLLTNGIPEENIQQRHLLAQQHGRSQPEGAA